MIYTLSKTEKKEPGPTEAIFLLKLAIRAMLTLPMSVMKWILEKA